MSESIKGMKWHKCQHIIFGWLIKLKVIYRQAFLRIGVVICFNIMPLTLNSYLNLLHFVLKNLFHFVSGYCNTLHQILLRFMLISEVAVLFGNICTIGPHYLKVLSRTPCYLEQKVISLGFGCYFSSFTIAVIE